MRFQIVSDLDVRRLKSGRRMLLDDFVCLFDGKRRTLPQGFDSDYSSWKGWIPGPGWERIDVAGLWHDWIWRFGYLGIELDAEPIGFWEGNKIWWQIARHGTDETSAGPIASGAGYLGLTAGGWVSWLRYRRTRRGYAEGLRARAEEARKAGPDGDQGEGQGQADYRRGPASGPGL